MTTSPRFTVYLFCCVAWIAGTGCSPSDPAANNDVAGDQPQASLEAAERVAVVGGTQAGMALARGAGVSQQAFDAFSLNVGSLLSGARVKAGGMVTLGSCPEVKIGGLLNINNQDPTLQIDYGDQPCQPAGSSQSCSGDAAGSFNQNQQTLSLTFNDITCGGQVLSGTADMAFALLLPGLQLVGLWDLAWAPGNDMMSIVGNGDIRYASGESTVQTFNGTVGHQGQTWTLVCTALKSSYGRYGSYVPFAGTISLQGDTIRTLVIAFNENSPETGQVTVTIGSFPPIDTTLHDLQEWIDLLAVG